MTVTRTARPEALAPIAARLARKLGPAGAHAVLDIPDSEAERAIDAEIFGAADRAEREAFRVRQAANRQIAYTRHLPSRYTGASYAGLRPTQDPRGLIASWWDRGPRTLLLAGPARTGKTYAAYAIANAVHADRHWVVARSAADLSAGLKPDSDEPLLYSYATECDLLVLDDLGRERVTDWWLDQVQRIVDARCGNVRRLVVTTNSEPTKQAAYAAIADRYGDPIAERIIDGGGVVILDGPAIREVVTEW